MIESVKMGSITKKIPEANAWEFPLLLQEFYHKKENRYCK